MEHIKAGLCLATRGHYKSKHRKIELCLAEQ